MRKSSGRWCRIGLWSVILLSGPSHWATPTHAEPPKDLRVIVNDTMPLEVSEAQFSPDGKVVASLTYTHGVDLWDALSGRLIGQLRAQTFFTAMRFIDEGKRIVTLHKDGALHIWDAASNDYTATLAAEIKDWPADAPEYSHEAWSLSVDAAGRFAAIGDDEGFIRTWNIAEGKQTGEFRLPLDENANPQSVRFPAPVSSDGARLVMRGGLGAPSAAVVVNAADGAPIATYDHPLIGSDLFDIIGEDGVILSAATEGCGQQTLKFLPLPPNGEPEIIDAPATCTTEDGTDPPPAPSVFYSSDRKRLLVTRAGASTATIWDVGQRRLERKVTWPDAGLGRAIGAAGDLSRVVTGEEGRLEVREIADGKLVSRLESPSRGAREAHLSPRGEAAALQIDADNHPGDKLPLTLVRPFSAAAPKLVEVEKETTMYGYSADGAALLVGNKGRLSLLKAEDGTAIRTLDLTGAAADWNGNLNEVRLGGPEKDPLIVGLRPGGTVDVEEGQRDVVVLGAARGELRKAFGDGIEALAWHELALSPDGRRIAIGFDDATVEVWDVSTARRLALLADEADKESSLLVSALAFSPDGKWLAVGLWFEGVDIWDLDTGQRLFRLPIATLGGRLVAGSLAFSSDKQLIAAGTYNRGRSSGDIGHERRVLVWETATGKERFAAEGHESGVAAVAFAPGDKRLISTAHDGTVRYWDTSDGAPLAITSLYPDGGSVTVTRDGFFAATPDKAAYVTPMRGERMLSAADLAKLERPDLVDAFLAGDPDGRYARAVADLKLD